MPDRGVNAQVSSGEAVLKRYGQMFGRAGLALLRKRVLLAV
ncbi:hypothetical protein AB0L49_35435 [Streptomyces antimycoticus]